MESIPFGLQRPVKPGLTGVRENAPTLAEMFNGNSYDECPGAPRKKRHCGVRENAPTLAELYGNSIDECPGAPRKKGRYGVEDEEPRALWDA